jgi:hypothetical protein
MRTIMAIPNDPLVRKVHEGRDIIFYYYEPYFKKWAPWYTRGGYLNLNRQLERIRNSLFNLKDAI